MKPDVITIFSILSKDKAAIAEIIGHDEHQLFFDSDSEDEGTTSAEEILLRLCQKVFHLSPENSGEVQSYINEMDWIITLVMGRRSVVYVNLDLLDENSNDLIWRMLKRYSDFIIENQIFNPVQVDHQEFLNLLARNYFSVKKITFAEKMERMERLFRDTFSEER